MDMTTLVTWLGHANAALLGQGPLLTIGLCLLAGYGAGQFFKWPMRYYLDGRMPEPMLVWSIRSVAMLASFSIGVWLGGLPPAVFLIVAMFQPTFYKLLHKVVRRYAPWLLDKPTDDGGGGTETDLTVMRGKQDP